MATRLVKLVVLRCLVPFVVSVAIMFAPAQLAYADEKTTATEALAALLREGGLAYEEGLTQSSTGILTNPGALRPLGMEKLANMEASESVTALGKLIEKEPSLGNAVVARLQVGVRQLGLKGDALRAYLQRPSTWGPPFRALLNKGGFVALEVLGTVLAFHTIGVVVQADIDAAYAEYKAEMESLGDAAEQEAYNNNMRLLANAIAEGRHSLCSNLTFGSAARRLRDNMQDRSHPTQPFIGIIENCEGQALQKPVSESSTNKDMMGEERFRLSGGIDPKFKAALQEKVSKTGATLLLEGSDMAFTFVPNTSDAGGSTGSLEMSPPVITHTWQFTYKTGMVDRLETTCELKRGQYSMLSPNEPMKMVGAWGGALACRTKATRDGKLTRDTSADTVMMINYDKDTREWIVIVVGVQDGQWRLH